MKKRLTFFGVLLQARTTAHLLHFKTRNYAEHIALEEFYTGLLELTDRLIETSQGADGIHDIVVHETSTNEWADGVSFVHFIKDVIEIYKKEFTRDAQVNVVDDIATLTEQTLYKLTYLK